MSEEVDVAQLVIAVQGLQLDPMEDANLIKLRGEMDAMIVWFTQKQLNPPLVLEEDSTETE